MFVSSRVWALWASCLPSRSLQGSALQLQLTPVSKAVHKFSDYHFKILSRCMACLFYLEFGLFGHLAYLHDPFRAQLFSFSQLQSVLSSFTVPKKDSVHPRPLEGCS